MAKVHDRAYTRSIFYTRNQSEEIRNRIYTWSSCISQQKLGIFTLGLERVDYSSIFFLIKMEKLIASNEKKTQRINKLSTALT